MFRNFVLCNGNKRFIPAKYNIYNIHKNFIDAQNDIIYLKDQNLRYIFVNESFKLFFNIKEKDILHKTDFMVSHSDMTRQLVQSDYDVLNHNNCFCEDFSYDNKVYRINKFPVQIKRNTYGVGGNIRDITTEYNLNKKNNDSLKRNQVLLGILTKDYESINEQLDDILKVTIKMTDSKIGFIYLYDNYEDKYKLCSYYDKAFDDPYTNSNLCSSLMNNNELNFNFISITKPIILNDVRTNTGGNDLSNIIIVPIIHNNKTEAFYCLGNKDCDYTDYDVRQVSKIVHAMWNAIKQNYKISYMSYHDSLTNLYNRRYFEDKIRKIDTPNNLPISIIMGDINGLKMTNDIFGHKAGDDLLKNAAQLLKKSCRSSDILTRWGGDEYMLLLPSTDNSTTEKIMERIQENFSNEFYRGIKPSISLGCATKTAEDEDLFDVLDCAESKMYLEKSIFRNNSKNVTVESLTEFFHSNITREKIHSDVVYRICESIGHSMKLSDDDMNKLKRAAYLHDIGKVAINDKWIKTSDVLFEKELSKVRQHSVIGYRILSIFPETIDIANLVLHHHEKWDGSGYPRNLRGEEIPLLARIISIAESFDAMTNKLSYKSCLSTNSALEEIKNNAGTQFDPVIAKIFLDKY